MVEDKTDQPERQKEEVTLQTIRDEIRCQGTNITKGMKRQSDEQWLTLGLAAAVALIVGAATVEDIGAKMAMAFGAAFLCVMAVRAGISLKLFGGSKR
jgi:hypothetical protein